MSDLEMLALICLALVGAVVLLVLFVFALMATFEHYRMVDEIHKELFPDREEE
jgi:hypothetical protein